MRCLPSSLSSHEWKFEKERALSWCLREIREIFLVKSDAEVRDIYKYLSRYLPFNCSLGILFLSQHISSLFVLYCLHILFHFQDKSATPSWKFSPTCHIIKQSQRNFFNFTNKSRLCMQISLYFFCGFNFHTKLTIFN